MIDNGHAARLFADMRQAERHFAERYTALRPVDLDELCMSLSPQGPSTCHFASTERFSASAGRLQGRDGRPEQHQHADRVFVIRAGAGILRVGGTIADPETVTTGELLGSEESYDGYETMPLEPGMVVSISAGTPYQLLAKDMEFAFLVFRIGGGVSPRRA